MKPYYSIIILLIIIGSAVATGRYGYCCAKNNIINDMNQALAATITEKHEGWITPDTITDYRNHLKIKALKESSLIYFAMNDKENGLKSKRMTWRDGKGNSLQFQGYANCSFASVFAMSNQRQTILLSLTAMLWAAFSIAYFRRQHKDTIVIGRLTLDNTSHQFLISGKQYLSLTPMQERLLTMFFHAEGHQLGKRQICDELWPRKPDASDTLYALVRRIRPILADNGLTISTSRGKDYRLTAI